MMKASMATKCIDHIPPPIVIAAATGHTLRANPLATPACPLRSRAVYDAKEATRTDRATRYGSCVPVTTIGTAPIRTRDQRATNPPTHLQMQPATLSGASLKADVGRRSPDDLVGEHQDAPLALC